MKRIMECVPNFSEGRDPDRIERIEKPLRDADDVLVLDSAPDEDHNRLVVTMIGKPEALKSAMLKAMEAAIAEINMEEHSGGHPRMGAVDVVPFTPVRNVEMEECVQAANELASRAAEKLDLPIYLYEEAATSSERENLAHIRKGEYEGFEEKIKKPEWEPDYGPQRLHETAGATVIGARMPLVAFNVNLDTKEVEIAKEIARKVRHSGGGLRFCKAIGLSLEDKDMVQVSMNMTDYTQTSLYQSFEMIKFEAERYGVEIAGSELIGLLPAQALFDVADYYLGLDDFSPGQIMENRLLEEL
ncbi:glutamate formimidoyltransferase [Halarsenatibacter silvermanii]|uniref:glutamate formimidoyltransferase n=1 Tax=Halarsenatibacter silvermanii TaxID=321763 RepID=A0A1G9RH07_9FIRM|nr:glutamate formimidoyltransferase [Halarsenatibacter silvermanii]SDM22483.1 glutamate formiminotransferase [Halarsenatibacter silvermanii]